MSIRSFDWLDLPTLHRYRNNSVYLHSSLVLTRGPMLIPGALLSSIAPGMGVITMVSTDNGDTNDLLIGQVVHTANAEIAHLTFLTPDGALDSGTLPDLLEHMYGQVGDRGAMRVLADIDEGLSAFETIRKVGFSIYARQRVWRLKNLKQGRAASLSWKVANEQDVVPVRSLYYNLVPGLVQQVEPFPASRLNGLVYRQSEEVLGYVELKYGHRGIWAQPFVHPDAEDVADRLIDLLENLPNRRSRPIYLCVRSYEFWLESRIEDMGAEPGPLQAVIVKHLAAPQKALRTYTIPAVEGGHPEISAPIARIEGD